MNNIKLRIISSFILFPFFFIAIPEVTFDLYYLYRSQSYYKCNPELLDITYSVIPDFSKTSISDKQKEYYKSEYFDIDVSRHVLIGGKTFKYIIMFLKDKLVFMDSDLYKKEKLYNVNKIFCCGSVKIYFDDENPIGFEDLNIRDLKENKGNFSFGNFENLELVKLNTLVNNNPKIPFIPKRIFAIIYTPFYRFKKPEQDGNDEDNEDTVDNNDCEIIGCDKDSLDDETSINDGESDISKEELNSEKVFEYEKNIKDEYGHTYEKDKYC